MSPEQEQAVKPVLVDVSTEETHYVVQCEDIRLISSTFKPISADENTESNSNFAFRIRAIVDGQTSYSYLEVQTRNFISDEYEDLTGYELGFVLMGVFQTQDEKMTPEALGDFVKRYTVTILWPYAREYATDQLRRAGLDHAVLPIINPQVVTEHIVENDLVQVEIIRDEGEEK